MYSIYLHPTFLVAISVLKLTDDAWDGLTTDTSKRDNGKMTTTIKKNSKPRFLATAREYLTKENKKTKKTKLTNREDLSIKRI